MLSQETDRDNSKPARQSGLTVLSVTGLEDDHLALKQIFDHSNWDLRAVRSLSEASDFLRSNTVSVAICERDLPDGTWKSLLAELAQCESPPVLVVSSRIADDYLWAEVLNLGGCDVLAKPFDAREVIWTVSMAWNEWNARVRRPQIELVEP